MPVAGAGRDVRSRLDFWNSALPRSGPKNGNGPGREGQILLMKSPSPIAAVTRSRRRIIAAALLILLALGTAGFYLRRETIARREAQTVTLALDQGRTGDAAIALERWLEASPDSAQAHFLKARLAWMNGDLPAVEREVDRAEELGYTSQPLARLKGLLLSRGTRKPEAELLLRHELDTSRGADREVAETLVRMYMESFRLLDATVVLDRWMKAAPRDARPYVLQADIDLRVQASAEVIIGRYQEALERDGSLDQARLGLAKQLHMSHRFREAAAEYATYLARQPEDPLGYLGAGQNALEMGDDKAAEPLLDRALELAPRDSEALAACATLELHRGRLEKALARFDQAIAADPFDHWNCYQRMLVLSRLGRKAEADVERQRVDRLRRDQDRFGEISRALVRNPLDSKLRGEAATWLMEHGHENEAVDWANLVLQGDPTHSAMNRLLADHFRKKGQTGLANFYESQIRRVSE
jgi:tetratricopeptide (TPR) repeat protein